MSAGDFLVFTTYSYIISADGRRNIPISKKKMFNDNFPKSCKIMYLSAVGFYFDNGNDEKQ